MTKQKTFKRRVRQRMEKTGESYAAARGQLISPPEEPPEETGLSSNESVVKATGRSWAEWYALLDEDGARQLGHAAIARHVGAAYDVSGWWAQQITVSYERARGMRAVHERPEGYSVTATKTIGASAEALFDALAGLDDRLTVRTATKPRGARFNFEDGRTRVIVGIEAKGPEKATIALEHARLEADEAEPMKAHWRERLARLKSELEAR
jgi:hypothetical protein